MLAAKRYFSGDEDGGWERGATPRPASGSTATSPPEGVSSNSIVSGLVASRKKDHTVSSFCMKDSAIQKFSSTFVLAPCCTLPQYDSSELRINEHSNGVHLLSECAGGAFRSVAVV